MQRSYIINKLLEFMAYSNIDIDSDLYDDTQKVLFAITDNDIQDGEDNDE